METPIRMDKYPGLFESLSEKTCLPWFENNTGADQPVRLHSLISAFVIYFLEGIISRLATSEFQISR